MTCNEKGIIYNVYRAPQGSLVELFTDVKKLFIWMDAEVV